MKSANWPLEDRGDGRIEIICPHGVGHSSMLLSLAVYPAGKWLSWMGVHGCDGCCSGEAFKAMESAHLLRLERMKSHG